MAFSLLFCSGLPEDKETALLLYSQGADAGDEESQQDAARLQDEMSRLKAQHAGKQQTC